MGSIPALYLKEEPSNLPDSLKVSGEFEMEISGLKFLLTYDFRGFFWLPNGYASKDDATIKRKGVRYVFMPGVPCGRLEGVCISEYSQMKGKEIGGFMNWSEMHGFSDRDSYVKEKAAWVLRHHYPEYSFEAPTNQLSLFT